jgi:anaerobic selenocysteine-containing dehydrogenase
LDASHAYADLVLPIHHFLEDWDIHPLGQSGKTLILRRPVVLPRQASRGLGDWVLVIANRLGLSSALPWENYKAALVAGIPTEAFDVLMNQGRFDVSGPAEAPTPSPGHPPDPTRFELPANLLSQLATDPRFPFVLLPAWEGVRPMDLSWVRELPVHPGNPAFLRVEMGPADAERLGLRDGEPVVVETRTRSWSGRLRIRTGLADGALSLADGFATGAARIRRAS